MPEVGRPSTLTDELTFEIRKAVLEGKLYKTIQEELNISPNTWDQWVYVNHKDFRNNLIKWRQERLIKKAEKLSEEILDLLTEGEDGRIDTNLLRIKQKEAEFIRERLSKEQYSTRIDHTTKGEKIETSKDTQEIVEKALNDYFNGQDKGDTAKGE